MFTYILIGCFVAVLTDYLSYVFMNNEDGLTLIGSAFIVVFWPLVLIYLSIYMLGEFLERIGRWTRKKGG